MLWPLGPGTATQLRCHGKGLVLLHVQELAGSVYGDKDYELESFYLPVVQVGQQHGEEI